MSFVIRPIEPGDKELLVNGLRQLSEESIRKRFLAAKPRFTTAELRYLTEVDGVNHIALVAVLEDDPDQLVAVARCVRLPDRPGTAEMAIVVGDPWQGQGLGTRAHPRAGRRGRRRRHPPLRGHDAGRQRGRAATDADLQPPARGGTRSRAGCAR